MVPKNKKALFLTIPKANFAPHNPRVKPTPLELQFVSVVGVQMSAKIADKTRKNKKKKDKEKEREKGTRKKKKEKKRKKPRKKKTP